jgi:purine-binding chemotaxis protein CheW
VARAMLGSWCSDWLQPPNRWGEGEILMSTTANTIKSDDYAGEPRRVRQPTRPLDPVATEFLTFTLGHEEYGIEILKVREIKSYDAVTRIANAPAFIKGVINLRGSIVPVVDLRIKFRLNEVVYNEFTVMIVVSLGQCTVGIVVDSVSDVVTLAGEQIKPAPELGSSFDVRYLLGLGTLGTRILILLDIEHIMTGDELASIDSAST